MFENQKMENMEIEDIFYINLHLKDGLVVESTACLIELMPQGALTSLLLILLLCRSDIVSGVYKVGHT